MNPPPPSSPSRTVSFRHWPGCQERWLSFTDGHSPHDWHGIATLSTPANGTPASGLGVVILGGGAQSRVGAHRQFVLLARAWATQGHAVLRFDWPGLGDATGTVQPFDQLAGHAERALNLLKQHCPEARRLVLLGLCDGASVALMHQARPQSTAVDGLCLINPWVRSAHSLARTHLKHHYLQRLRQASFWQKVLSGQVGWPQLRDLGLNLLRAGGHHAPTPATFQERMRQGWCRFQGHRLVLISQHDTTGQEFETSVRQDPAWTPPAQAASLQWQALRHADHTCSTPDTHDALEQSVSRWLASLAT